MRKLDGKVAVGGVVVHKQRGKGGLKRERPLSFKDEEHFISMEPERMAIEVAARRTLHVTMSITITTTNTSCTATTIATSYH